MSERELVRSFRAMNTSVEAAACPQSAQSREAALALYEVECLFREVEGALSRFNPESELSRLNASAGSPFPASSLLFAAVSRALDAARLTGGVVDPTILNQLRSAGYDRTFEEVHHCRDHANLHRNRYTWRDIQLDANSSRILTPAGCGLDLGGVGKGWTLDCARIRLRRFANYAVDAGGDIIVQGTQNDGHPWTIGVANPFEEDRDLLRIRLSDGAVCTSSILRRRWFHGNGPRHHIIDPRTGAPAHSGVVAATVVAPSALFAETLTKAAIILGVKRGLAFIRRCAGAEGLLVLNSGELAYTAGFKRLQNVA